jgi:alpha-L-fucosidase 2
VLRLFSTWPKDWNADFQLLARGAFVVGSAMHDGQIPLVEIQSQAGHRCQLQNPWPDAEVVLWRNGQRAESLRGELLTFPTSTDETIVVVPAGTEPQPINVPAT